MKEMFTVHNVVRVPVNMPVEVGGESTLAAVTCLEVELTSDSNLCGSLTLRYFGAQATEAEALFKQDGKVSVSFDKISVSSDKV